MDTGYSGTVTLGANLEVTTLVEINQGTLTGSASYTLTFGYEFDFNSGAITGDTLRLCADGLGTTYMNTTLSATFKSLQASSDLVVKSTAVITVRAITVDADVVLTIDTGAIRNTPYFDWGFSNLGEIAGEDGGQLQLMNRASVTQSITFGEVNCIVKILGDASTAGGATLQLAADAVIGGELWVWSLHATYTCTLDLTASDYDLSATKVVIDDRGIINARGGDIECTGDWDSTDGTFTAAASSLTMAGNDLSISMDETDWVYDLRIDGYVTCDSSIAIEHDFDVTAGSTLIVDDGTTLTYNCSGGGAYTNSGIVMGSGEIDFTLDNADRSITFGHIRVDTTSIIATSETTADRTLTMLTDTKFGDYLIIMSNHGSYLMICDTTAGNVSIHLGFTNGTRGMVYYSYVWSVPSDNAYVIGISGGSYRLLEEGTNAVILTESVATGFADNVTQYAVYLCPHDGEITFENGTYTFFCGVDFYIGGWNRSVQIDIQTDLTISGSGNTTLEFREGLEVDTDNGVAIFVLFGDAQPMTFSNLNFTVSESVTASYTNGIFLDAYTNLVAFSDLTIEDCTFWNLTWGVWADAGAVLSGSGNMISDNVFYGGNGYAFHNQPYGATVTRNTFQNEVCALMVDSVSNISIEDNMFIDCGDGAGAYCIYIWDDVDNCAISDNIMTGVSEADSKAVIIGHVAGKPDCSNITIDGNGMDTFQYGIQARGGNDTLITNNAFMDVTHLIDDEATESTITGNANYSLSGSFEVSVTIAAGGVSYEGVTLIAHPASMMVNITMLRYTTKAWEFESDATNTTVTYIVYGLRDDLMYEVYHESVRVDTYDGPSFSFTVNGNGSVKILEWYAQSVSGLVVLAVNMVSLGMVISIVVGWVIPFTKAIRDGKFRRLDQMTTDLIRGAIFIVIAILMTVMLNNIVLG